MSAMEEKLARVESTWLGTEDHGIFTAVVNLDYGNGGSKQGAGTYDLRGGASCYRFIAGVLRVCHAASWEDLRGKVVYALVEDGLVRGLRSLPFFGAVQEFRFDTIYDEEVTS